MNKLVTTLSIIGFLAASNISAAEGGNNGSVPFSGYSTQKLNEIAKEINNLNISSDATGASLVGSAWSKDAKEAWKKDKAEQVKDENPDSEKSTISKLETIYELNKLQYNSIFGLLLDFSEGKLSIENLEQEMINKIKACQKKEKELLGNIEESSEIKIYAETITGMWELYAKIVSIDKKNLQEQKTSLEKLREQYAKLAAGWFSYEYGMRDKEGVAKIKLEQGKESAQNKDTNSTSLIAPSDFERARLRFDYAENEPYREDDDKYIIGLFLDFINGNRSIEDLEVKLEYRVDLYKQEEKRAFKNGKKMRKGFSSGISDDTWEKVVKEVSIDKKRLLENKTNIKNLREKYNKKAMGWSSYIYGARVKK